MGVWALFLIVIGIFELVKTNLLKNAQIKFGSGSTDKNEKSSIASSSLIINATTSLLFVFFIFFFANLLSSWLNTGKDLAAMLDWFIPGILFMIFFSHLEAIQQSHLDFKGVFAGHFVRQFLFFSIIVVHKILGIPFTLTDLAIYQSISIFFGAITLYLFSRKYLNNRFNPTILWIKKILNYGGYIFGSGTVAGIFQNLDQLMISRFGAHFVAPYNAAFRINALVDVPSYAASEVLFPKASLASVEEGPKRIKFLFEKMVGILLSFTIPTALFIMIFPGLIITIIAGPNYLDAVPILQLYMVAGILRPAQNQAANLLNSIGKAKLCFYINVGYLIVNLLLNYICLSYFGFYGAAIGTVITFILGAIAWYFIMKKEIALELSNILQYAIEVYKMGFDLVMNVFQKKQVRSKPL